MLYCNKVISSGKNGRMKPSRTMLRDKKLRKRLMSLFPINYRRDPNDKRDFKFKTATLTEMKYAHTLPNEIDHTLDMSPVKDQGNLGSCVGFAVSAMKECQERKEHLEEIAKGKRGRPKVYDYSEAWLYWNSKKVDPWPNEEGTSIRYAMKVLQKIGVPTEKGWPYKDVNDVNQVGEPKKWADLVARWALIGKYWRIETLTELRLALINGPVPIGVPCFYEFFFVGSDGVIPYPSNSNQIYGGHAICAVGYDNDKQLVKFKNSWGKTWGDDGYGYLPYKYIEDFLWDAWTCEDLNVTRDMLKGARELI